MYHDPTLMYRFLGTEPFHIQHAACSKDLSSQVISLVAIVCLPRCVCLYCVYPGQDGRQQTRPVRVHLQLASTINRYPITFMMACWFLVYSELTLACVHFIGISKHVCP